MLPEFEKENEGKRTDVKLIEPPMIRMNDDVWVVLALFVESVSWDTDRESEATDMSGEDTNPVCERMDPVSVVPVTVSWRLYDIDIFESPTACCFSVEFHSTPCPICYTSELFERQPPTSF
ncbi:hypothetical protein BLNAU_22398 [Blattamonas nauphoetae]|uniref:Uncharacterized protein n=1 Tax=Blattamonas nauphoetae TaxID=2049346 RepID=A0ABQ9WVC2_9EUKA|nr:hypothetical protein BLNAU_22398 [Blattamonas nauphoetae]